MECNDWVKKNWDFLSTRAVKVESGVIDFVQDWRVPTDGKFFGTEKFFRNWGRSHGSEHKGFKKLFLRPYIVQEMPEGVEAIYISKKNYDFDTEGNITGLHSVFEKNFYVFR